MKEVSGEGVQQQVGEVELEGRARTKDPVQAEGEGGQRPVRLVRACVRQWNAPEVRGDQGREGRRACYNRVGHHRRPARQMVSRKKYLTDSEIEQQLYSVRKPTCICICIWKKNTRLRYVNA